MEEIKKIISDLKALVEQRFAELKTLLSQSQTVTTKKKRKLNAYQLFMKDCLKQETGSYPERFTKCAAKYKELKEKGEI